MKIHEYQAKELFRRYGVATPEGRPAGSASEAADGARELGGSIWVVKSQIHAGGRGKGRFKNDPEGAGGVRLCRSIEEVEQAARAMLGQVLVTKQTGADGKIVERVYVEQGCDIARELYLAVLLDRAMRRPVMMASPEGGMDIEEVAETKPEAIHKVWIDPAIGFQPNQARQLAFALGLEGAAFKSALKFMSDLYTVWRDSDANLAEINPLVVTGAGEVLALDAKMTFDDNALFRHPAVMEFRDLSEEDPAEIEASKHDLSYVNLDGNIGCMVNGAGLAMATMDIIKHYGGEPANFLDVGGGTTAERVTAAFEIITRDPKVEAILVNIFGGIVKCDLIAQGVLSAVRNVGLKVPLVVRLEGTNVEEGKRILAESDLAIINASDMADAAQKAVAAVAAAPAGGAA
jgi:succinyl-CoA synthetase beta subunit